MGKGRMGEMGESERKKGKGKFPKGGEARLCFAYLTYPNDLNGCERKLDPFLETLLE